MTLDKSNKQLNELLGIVCTLYPNGIFNALDVDTVTKDKLLSKYKNSAIIKNLSAQYYRNDNGEPLYQLYGKANMTNLEEAIEIHNTLNPKIWDTDNNLLPEVAEKISQIVEFFKSKLTEDNIALEIEDVYILGSNANYTYTDKSDLDIHIIADESFDCKDKHLPLLYNAYKSAFNKKYDITINDIPIELYVENAKELSNISAGIYSLNNGWLNDPTELEMPKIDDVKLAKDVEEWELRYNDIIKNPSIDSVESYINDIYELRGEGLATNDEFAIENLIFKEIRNLGYLDNLKELLDNLYSKKLSL